MQISRRMVGRLAASVLACITLMSITASVLPAATAAAAAPRPDHAAPRPDHVVMVMMENHSFDSILNNPSTSPNDQDPFIKSLAAEGATFTNSYGVTHPSLPNYYALLSASDIVKDNTWPAPSSVNTDNLPNQLNTHGYSFADYADQGKPTQWLRYTTTPGTPDHLSPMDKRLADFPSTPTGFASLPTVSLVVGNGDQSMHDGTIAQGDTWVKSKFGGYIDWARTHNSLFVLTWDEDDFTPVNRVATIFYGPMAKAGTNNEKINHYNVLRTILDMYGLSHINHTADVPTISDAWDLSRTGPIIGLDGQCLAYHKTGEANQGGVGMGHCESAPNQRWIRHADGTIRITNQCLATAAGGTAGGSDVGIAACDGTSGQEWLPQTDGSLLNPASARCLTVPGDPPHDNGTQPELQDCDGQVHQKWVVPDFVALHQLTISGDPVVAPGSSASVTTTYTNDSSPVALTDASIALTVANGWTATATTASTFSRIEPGQSARTSWTVTPQAAVKPGVYQISGRATYAGAAATDQGSGPITVPYPSMDAARNNAGISDDANHRAANLDGAGYSLSAQTLAAAGLTPGATVTHGGVRFTWPNTTPGTPDNIVAGGQTIRLTGSGAKLGILATNTYGTSSTTGTITYTDGTTQTLTLPVADWWSSSPAPGSDILATLPYINAPNGAAQYHPVNIYGATAPLQPGKTVSYVTLPNAGPQGVTHILAAAIG